MYPKGNGQTRRPWKSTTIPGEVFSPEGTHHGGNVLDREVPRRRCFPREGPITEVMSSTERSLAGSCFSSTTIPPRKVISSTERSLTGGGSPGRRSHHG